MHNRIEDAIVTLLGSIDNVSDANSWLTKPKVVARGFTFGAWNGAATPALFVETADWDMEDRGVNHVQKVRVVVWCLTDASATGLDLLNKLEADVMYAVLKSPNEYLSGLVRRLKVLRGEPEYERRSVAGKAISAVVLEAEYAHDHTAVT
jgi:hypothetical protein